MEDSLPSSVLRSAHVFVVGRVQGVGYRASTRAMAERLGLRGWVKNLPDGRVEALFEGSQESIEAMLRWCHVGPPAADVQRVQVTYRDPLHLHGFQVTRS